MAKRIKNTRSYVALKNIGQGGADVFLNGHFIGSVTNLESRGWKWKNDFTGERSEYYSPKREHAVQELIAPYLK